MLLWKLKRDVSVSGGMMELNQQIIDKATELFNQKGLRFTLDEISEQLHISKKTIYVYFRCKEDLLMTMADQVFASIQNKKRQIIEEEMPYEDKLKKMLVALPDEYLNIDFRKLEHLEEKYPAVYERVRQYLETGWDPVIELIEQGQKQGILKKVSIPVLQTMVSSSIRSFINDGILESNDINYTEALDSMVEIIINGIKER
ncbi:MAG: TetR/AcrR family transcriptional regulator [Erysipelotrichaceae bacterium]|nr:TetR/AcrR family transcriptional regulator [Erysipelotrichaceae bacterium]